MTRRTKIIIAIVIAIIVIAIIIFLLSFFRRGQVAVAPKSTNQPAVEAGLPAIGSGQPLGMNVQLSSDSIVVSRSAEEMRSADLVRMAMPFVERFGSYSNQSNYKNIEDLMIYMSKSMKKWAEDYIQKNRSNKADTSIYLGMTTKALSSQVVDFNDSPGTAKIKVSTQRRESSGAAANAKPYYQDILVSFIKENGAWKVDSAYWQ